MTIKISLDTQTIINLDVSAAKEQISSLLIKQKIEIYEQQLEFVINYQREANDPRELSEIPEIRLWFVRLDSIYPWLPFLLNWKTGELVRYTAMLVPHQFNRSEGVLFNPEALELFVMNKTFVLSDWLQQQKIPARSRLRSMAQMFGYELNDSFFEMI
ncbi:MAG: CRR6 family NdhI maturation factor [Waterburya sp.]